MEKDKKLAQVFHYDLYGKRNEKYSFLLNNTLQTVPWQQLEFEDDNYFFVPKNFELKEEYEKGFKIDDLFPINSCGIKTQRDDASIKFIKKECEAIKSDFINLSNQELSQKYGFVDVRDWNINDARKDLQINNIIADKIHYRPFDFRCMNYTGRTKGVMGYPRYSVMKHFIYGDNVGLVVARQCVSDWRYVFVTKRIGDINLTGTAGAFGGGNVFPLYLYPETDKLFSDEERKPNLNETIINEISQRTDLQFTEEKITMGLNPLSGSTSAMTTFAPIDVLITFTLFFTRPRTANVTKNF